MSGSEDLPFIATGRAGFTEPSSMRFKPHDRVWVLTRFGPEQWVVVRYSFGISQNHCVDEIYALMLPDTYAEEMAANSFNEMKVSAFEAADVFATKDELIEACVKKWKAE